ncbi:MAG: C1 family peptidase [Crocinitomicaceae bacterium]|nr:C1 family peptidase [Crocinitomicaceae bacterium]MDG2505773.1 C1 family peptidase [Crocinitomicaceae bacterium]
MKSIITLTLCLGIAVGVNAQVFKNTKESKYQFKEVVRLDASPVESQGRTGTCWSFSALSFLESEIMRINKLEEPIVLSEMFIVRKAYEAKAEKYIRMDGRTNFGEGGAFHDIPFVIENFGILPRSEYTGKKKKKDVYNHGAMFERLDSIVQKAKAAGKGLRADWITAYNDVLDDDMGVLPESFKYKGVEYTPEAFYNSLNIDMGDYVSLTSFTNHKLHKSCLLQIPDNWLWEESYNVTLDELFNATLNALKSGYSVAWGADVSEKGFSFKNGIAIAPAEDAQIIIEGQDNKNFSDGGADKYSAAFKSPVKELEVTQQMRQQGYDHKETTDDHGMHIVGFNIDRKGRYFFLVKNSWGTSNYPEGYLYVSEAYFKLKTINVYLHKDGIQDQLRSLLGI